MTDAIARPAKAEDVRSASEALYFRNQGEIRDAILIGTGLWVGDADSILEQHVVPLLPEFNGPPDDDAFIAWAIEVTKPEVEKYKFFYHLQKQYRKSVLAGVWSILRKNRDLADHDNPGTTAREIAEAVWVWVFQNLELLMVPGTAKLSTRLQAQGKFAALTWRKTRLRERQRDSGVDVERIGTKDGDYVLDEEDISCEESPPYEVSDGPDSLYCLEPSYREDESEPAPRQSLRRPIHINDKPSAKSGTPKVLCPHCHILQLVLPDSATDSDELTLQCGHVRTRQLLVAA